MNIPEIVKEIFVSFGVHKILTEQTQKAGGKIVDYLTDNQRRARLLSFIRVAMDDKNASKRLWERYLKNLIENGGKPGEENRFVNLLFPVLDAKIKPETLQKIFSDLGNMSDEDFNAALYFLENDALKQEVWKVWNKINGVFEKLTPKINEFAEELKKGGIY